MKLSVIIPTFTRSSILLKNLTALETQKLDKKSYEVIVINDGSLDDTAQVLREFKEKTSLTMRVFTLSDNGLSCARNLGIKKAKGEIILLLNDDVMPADEHFLEKHLETVRPDIAVQGRIEWHPELERTELMTFLSPSGPLFDYTGIKNAKNCNWRYFFATNMSIYRKWFDLEKFDEQHPLGHEDIELGYRLSKHDLRVEYAPHICAYHHHAHANFEEYLSKRMKRRPSYLYLTKKHPELRRSRAKQFIYNASRDFAHAAYLVTKLRVFRNFWWRSRLARYYK